MSDQNAIRPLAVSQQSFGGILWGGFTVASLFVLFRAYVRFSVFRRYFADDALVFAAWAMLLAYSVTWEKNYRTLYIGNDVEIGKIAPPPDLLSNTATYIHAEIAINLLNTCGLWAIKLSFMVFFRRLGQGVKKQRILWWIVMAALFAGFAITIGVYNWPCLVKPAAVIFVQCAQPGPLNFTRLSIRIITGCDVITDFLVLLIPINLLWGVQMSSRVKLGLLGLFSLTTFIMIVSILRPILTFQGAIIDSSWLWVSTTIEQSVAIIIACLVSYRAYFSNGPDVQRRKKTNGSSWQPLKYGGQTMTNGASQNATNIEAGKTSSSSIGEEAIPLDTIHVRQEYGIYPDPRGTVVDSKAFSS